MVMGKYELYEGQIGNKYLGTVEADFLPPVKTPITFDGKHAEVSRHEYIIDSKNGKLEGTVKVRIHIGTSMWCPEIGFLYESYKFS